MLLRKILPRLSYHNRFRLLLVPYALGIFFLVVVPALLSFGLAFFQYDALSPPRWIGEINFILAYTDELFKLSAQNSLALIILPVPLRIFSALLIARLLQRNGRLLAWIRAAVFLPTVIPAAAFALAWLWILNPLYGPLNILLQSIGVVAPAWFADPTWAKPALALMSFWSIGEGFLVSLAALHDIPAELEDAARVDGANSWQTFSLVIVPMVGPIMLLLLLRDTILTFQQSFTAVALTTGGGPYYATYTIPQFVYEQGFDLLSFGTASAALWIMYGLTSLVIALLYLIARQWRITATDEYSIF